MDSMPVEIYPVGAVRDIDHRAIEEHDIPGYSLMTRAGEAALSAAVSRYPAATRWQVVCGAGNNGGDGYVIARLAAAAGRVVSVIALVDPETLRGDAATAYRDFAAADGAVSAWSGELDPDAELLVDAILGSGLERALEGEFAAAVAAMNSHSAPIVAVDIPSGLHGDTEVQPQCQGPEAREERRPGAWRRSSTAECHGLSTRLDSSLSLCPMEWTP